MQALAITKIGTDKRGNPRLWLEGQKLSRAGFTPAVRYQLSVDSQTRSIVLRVAANGDRFVSHRKRGEDEIPIVDIASASLLADFEGLENLKVRFEAGAIVITPTATEARRIDRQVRLRRKLENNEPLAVGSVSTGLGVLALAMHEGLEASGLVSELQFAVEIDDSYLDQCAKANPAWSPNTIGVNAPMQEIAFDARALADLPKVDILEAGIPCTAHSLAGRAKKALAKPEDDVNSGHLVAGFLAIAAAVNPAIILVENVPQYMTSASYAILTNQLREWGYDIHDTVLSGQDFGCLEHRKRMAMVAVTQGLDFDIEHLAPENPIEARLGDILEDIADDDPRWSTMSYLRDKEVRDIEAGKGFRMQVFDADSDHVSTLGRGYQKNRSTEPKIQHPTDPELLRLITPFEHARIKGVPEAMVEGLGLTAAHQMLGQSIVAQPFRALANRIGTALILWKQNRTFERIPRVRTQAPITDLPLFA